MALPEDDDCGAVYRQAAPRQNACLPPETWQSLDVVFQAPRPEAPGRLLLQDHGDAIRFRNLWAIRL